MLGLNKDVVELLPHDDTWSKEFEKEKKLLKKVLGKLALDIQHVGSTAIPGLMAKPIIDIAVAVENASVLKGLIDVLSKAGYDVKDSINELGEILARKGTPDNRTHYIHIEVINSLFWNNHILFRDYLLKHAEYIKKYEDLKKEMFERYKDERKLYTAAKNDFIEEVLNLARAEKQMEKWVEQVYSFFLLKNF